jgi:hypothetical protein
MRALVLAPLLLAAACSTILPPEPGPVPLPADGPILYTCDDGAQLTVTYQGSQALVAIVGGVSMTLPMAGRDYYTNGRYTLRGAGRAASWAVGRRAAANCAGS